MKKIMIKMIKYYTNILQSILIDRKFTKLIGTRTNIYIFLDYHYFCTLVFIDV